MADGVDITPGTGAKIATDEIAGDHFQRVKIVTGPDGVNNGDVSEAVPMPVKVVGELVETIQALRLALMAFTRNQGLPNALGAMRVDGSGSTQPVSGTVTSNIGTGTLTAVTTVTGITNMGGQPAQFPYHAQMMLGADNLRRSIEVS